MSFFKIYNRPILCSVSTFKTPFNNDTWRKSVYPRKHIKDDDGPQSFYKIFKFQISFHAFKNADIHDSRLFSYKRYSKQFKMIKNFQELEYLSLRII